MIPQKQIVFGGGNGDCFRACIASILELPNDDRLPNAHGEGWFQTWQDWLGRFGLSIEFDATRIWRESFWIASVPSKNLEGVTHAIVMQGSQVAFDPSTKKTYRTGRQMLGAKVGGGWWFEVVDVRLLHKLHEYKMSFT